MKKSIRNYADLLEEVSKLKKDNQNNKIITLIEKFLKKHPQHEEALFLKGSQLFENNEEKKAIEIFD
ncbi:MAG: hypothetical protein U9O98_07215, partial [Asgard group archaeon]|nr:hypothetical protein [Asgard group archaeon]